MTRLTRKQARELLGRIGCSSARLPQLGKTLLVCGPSVKTFSLTHTLLGHFDFKLEDI